MLDQPPSCELRNPCQNLYPPLAAPHHRPSLSCRTRLTILTSPAAAWFISLLPAFAVIILDHQTSALVARLWSGLACAILTDRRALPAPDLEDSTMSDTTRDISARSHTTTEGTMQPLTPVRANCSTGHSYTNSSSGESALFSPWRSPSDKSQASPIDHITTYGDQIKTESSERTAKHGWCLDNAQQAVKDDLFSTGFHGTQLNSGPLDFMPNGADAHRAQLESMRNSAHESFDTWLTMTRQGKEQYDRDEQKDKKEQYAMQLAALCQSLPHAATTRPAYSPASVEPVSTSYPFNTVSSRLNCSYLDPTVPPSPRTPQSLTAQYFTGDQTEVEFSLFVGDLCPDLREDDLVRQFRDPPAWPTTHPVNLAHVHGQRDRVNLAVGPAPFWSTKSATIMTDPLTGASRGFGFVRFSSEKDCARALIEMQGMIIEPSIGRGGRPLRVCPATPKNRSVTSSTASVLTASSQLLQERLANAIQTEQQRGSTIDADLLARLSVQALTSTNASLKASKPSNDIVNNALNTTSALDPSNTTVFVGGLSSLISEETLKTFFVPFGEIRYVKIPTGKGCGFVQFAKKADAERAIERMQGFPIGGGRIRLSWGRSQGDKAAAQAAQHVVQINQLSGQIPLSPTIAGSFASNGPSLLSPTYGTADYTSYFLDTFASTTSSHDSTALSQAEHAFAKSVPQLARTTRHDLAQVHMGALQSPTFDRDPYMSEAASNPTTFNFPADRAINGHQAKTDSMSLAAHFANLSFDSNRYAHDNSRGVGKDEPDGLTARAAQAASHHYPANQQLMSAVRHDTYRDAERIAQAHPGLMQSSLGTFNPFSPFGSESLTPSPASTSHVWRQDEHRDSNELYRYSEPARQTAPLSRLGSPFRFPETVLNGFNGRQSRMSKAADTP